MAKRILIVDDATFMRTMIREIVLGAGYEVVGEAEDGLQALEMYRAEDPDLVTMDVTMPEMDGITALREILKIDAEARVIICSAMGERELVLEAMKAGALDFIVKPFKAESVLEAIQNALGEGDN